MSKLQRKILWPTAIYFKDLYLTLKNINKYLMKRNTLIKCCFEDIKKEKVKL